MRSREHITNTVTTLRVEKNMTQEDLASCLGVSRQTIVALEKGNYAPSVALALRIAKLFGVPVEDIFTLH